MRPVSLKRPNVFAGGIALALAACSAAPASDSRQAGQQDVSSAAELARILADPVPDSVIRLAPGDYGRVVVARKFTPKALNAGLTLASADPRNPARFAEIAINGVEKITVRDVAVACSPSIQPCAMYLVSVTNSSDVTLQGIRVTGMGGEDRGRQYGFFIRGSQNVKLSESSVTGTRYGVGMLSDRNVTIVGNEFSGLQTDGIRGGGVSDLLIAENVLANFSPKAKDHPDGIQLWSSRERESARRVVIRDNLIVRGNGGIVQGIFVRDTKLQLPFVDIKITGNLAIGTMYNGVSVAGVNGSEISNNTVLAYPDMRAYITVRNSEAVRLTDNRAMLFLFPDHKQPAHMSGNKQVPPRRQGDLSAISDWVRARPAMVERAGPLLRSLTEQAATRRASGR